MSGQRHLGASLALVSVPLLGACSLDGAGDVPAAREIVREYLVALAGESPDRGWSLILPDSRRAYRDQDEYLGLVESVIWDDVRWQFTEADDYCEDGGVYCSIRLEIPDPSNSVPEFLLDAPQSQPQDRLLTVRLNDDPASEGNAELIVYFGQFGERGILLGGG